MLITNMINTAASTDAVLVLEQAVAAYLRAIAEYLVVGQAAAPIVAATESGVSAAVEGAGCGFGTEAVMAALGPAIVVIAGAVGTAAAYCAFEQNHDPICGGEDRTPSQCREDCAHFLNDPAMFRSCYKGCLNANSGPDKYYPNKH
jgi:hypothetical protein